MNELQIINAIANACEDDTLRFQIIIQGSTLHIYINRPKTAELDYQHLKQRINFAITSLYPAKVEKIWLYSRILGKLEPDWQSGWSVETNNPLSKSDLSSTFETITNAVAAIDSVVDKIEQELDTAESFKDDPLIGLEELPLPLTANERNLESLELDLNADCDPLDLTQHCFIRNQRLLYAVLDEPQANIASLIRTFDLFEQSLKRSQIPILEAYFDRAIALDLTALDPKVRTWWIEIAKLDSDERHKLAIWLSRYCLNSQQTMYTINEVLAAEINLAKQQTSNSSSSNPNLALAKLSRQSSDRGDRPLNQSSWLKRLTLVIRKLLSNASSSSD